MKKFVHLLVTSGSEAALILATGAIGWAAHMPLLFASLGPTAYELVEKPNSPSARTYNIIVGHFLALGAGFLSLWLVHAWDAPKVASAEMIASPRLWAAVIAAAITTALTLALKATQPAALSTALIVTLGSMQTARAAESIIVAVLVLAAFGEPFRRQFAKTRVKPG